MPNVLDRFNTIKYQISEDGDLANLKNITQYIDIIADQAEISAYLYYDILQGERPDIVSQKLYGTPDYYWIFFLLNDQLRNGIGSWLMTDVEIEKYIENEYSPYWWCSGTAGGHDANSVFTNFSQELYQIPLQEKYLPHLRVTFESFGVGFDNVYDFKPYDITSLKINKYDHERVGLIVHQPSDYQPFSIKLFEKPNGSYGLEGAGDETQQLKPATLTFSGGAGGGAYETYRGTEIHQAEALLDDDYEDSLGNYNTITFVAGESFIGKAGNGIKLILEQKEPDPAILGGAIYIERPRILTAESGEINIIVKYVRGTTLNQFRNFIAALDFSNNNDHEMSAFPYLNNKEDIISSLVKSGDQQLVTRMAITHDESYLGWEWQKQCYDLGLHGWNMQVGPWLPERNEGVNSLCQQKFKPWIDYSEQRSAVYFNNHALFNFDDLQYATHEYLGEYKYAPDLNAPGYYSPDLIDPLDNLIVEKEFLDFYDIIRSETTTPTGILHVPRSTFGDYETQLNQSRRKLRVPRPEIVEQIVRGYQELLNRNPAI